MNTRVAAFLALKVLLSFTRLSGRTYICAFFCCLRACSRLLRGAGELSKDAAGAGDEWLVAGRKKKKAVMRGSTSIQVRPCDSPDIIPPLAPCWDAR